MKGVCSSNVWNQVKTCLSEVATKHSNIGRVGRMIENNILMLMFNQSKSSKN